VGKEVRDGDCGAAVEGGWKGAALDGLCGGFVRCSESFENGAIRGRWIFRSSTFRGSAPNHPGSEAVDNVHALPERILAIYASDLGT
jgi:hypothetical protein